jgi:Ser/Thr protein kinase RdoA (MazF antagonist)
MAALDLTPAAQIVLQRYPTPLGHGFLHSLGNHGGFSGASLWRINKTLCLRASPLSMQNAARLAEIHRLMRAARQDGLHFVPAVFATTDGATVVEHAGHLWELMDWMPGRASYQESPSRLKLQAACTALGRLHRSWADRSLPQAFLYPPVLSRRFQAAARGLPGEIEFAPLDPAHQAIKRARRVLPRWMEQIQSLLLGMLPPKPVPVQPCLCDVWHDHLLFDGDRLTGLVDYGAVKTDHIAGDLARLLGSLIEDDEERWRDGLVAYSQQRPLSEDDQRLAHALDITGTILGAANWMHWLSDPQKTFDNRAAAVQRLERLLTRIERWK